MRTAAAGAGPHIATPEAQIQRKLTFSLSVLPHRGTWDQAEVWRQALAFNNPPRSYTTGMEKNRRAYTPGTQPAGRSFLSVSGRNVVLSSVKRAEAGEVLILRLYNPSDDVTEASIQLPFIPADVQLARMDESPRPAMDAEAAPVVEAGGQVRVALAPRKVVTLRVGRK
jgi:alpha-mannosidase